MAGSEKRRSAAADVKAGHRQIRLCVPGSKTSSYGNAYIGNRVWSNKYTWYTFVPKFLYEQLRKVANLFFLATCILQLIPGVSPTGKYSTLAPLCIFMLANAIREGIQDFARYRADKAINRKNVAVLSRTRAGMRWVGTRWESVKAGQVLRLEAKRGRASLTTAALGDVNACSADIPADLVILATSEADGTCTITTKNLDGETNLKSKSAVPVTHAYVSSEASPWESALTPKDRFLLNVENPHKDMDKFKGILTFKPEEGDEQDIALTLDNVLLRGSHVENTETVYAMVAYAGVETKVCLSSKKPPLKYSSIDRLLNKIIVIILIFLLALCTFCVLMSHLYDKGYQQFPYIITMERYYAYELGTPKSDVKDIVLYLLHWATFFILFNNAVPISLLITVDISKMLQAFFIDSDPMMVHDGFNAEARTSNLNEDLGRVKHVFSDKTGTLTRNEMVFKCCSVAGERYEVDLGFNDYFLESMSDSREKEQMEMFVTMLAACNTVIPSEHSVSGYIATSPDEEALVKGAESLGFQLESRSQNAMTVRKLAENTTITFEQLHVVPFDSTRKRMSVVVRSNTGDFFVFTKGADVTMRPLLDAASEAEFERFYQREVHHYSCEGLRVLVFARKKVTASEVERLQTLHQKTQTAEEDKDEAEAAYNECVAGIEQGLELFGCSAVEDMLQEGVPECIYKLRCANIIIWMLTGDNLDTAQNIAFSCRLFEDHHNFHIHRIQVPQHGSQQDVLDEMDRITTDLLNAGPDDRHGLLFEGHVLKLMKFNPNDKEVTYQFYLFSNQFHSVVASRLEPLQKAELVEMTKNFGDDYITLAIGDGANDVPMIRAADVGIGIRGQEGIQAVLSSDYSIAQFRFLLRLLLVHGHWSYCRVSHTILYSFYKNIALYATNLWYQWYVQFSGQSVFGVMSLTIWNSVTTCLPVFTLGIVDRPVSERQMLENVELYYMSQESLKFGAWVFMMWGAEALMHSAICFFVAYFSLGGTETVLAGARSLGLSGFGTTLYTAILLVVSGKLFLISNAITFLTLFTIVVLSIGAWLTALLIFSYMDMWLFEKWTITTYGVGGTCLGSSFFWLVVLLATLVALSRDYIFKALKVNVWPTFVDNVRRDGFDNIDHPHGAECINCSKMLWWAQPPRRTVEEAATFRGGRASRYSTWSVNTYGVDPHLRGDYNMNPEYLTPVDDERLSSDDETATVTSRKSRRRKRNSKKTRFASMVDEAAAAGEQSEEELRPRDRRISFADTVVASGRVPELEMDEVYGKD